MTAVGFCLRAVNLRALRFGLVVLEANSETNLSLSVEFAAASGGRKKTGIEAYCVCRNGILLAVHFDEPAYRAGIFLVDSPAGDNLRVLQKSRHGQAKNYVRRRQRDSASVPLLSEVFSMKAGVNLKAVVLSSGGLDSTTCLGIAVTWQGKYFGGVDFNQREKF